MQKPLEFNYFKNWNLDDLRIRVPNGIRMIQYFNHTPRTNLETLWKRVCIIWKILQFNKQLTNFNNPKE